MATGIVAEIATRWVETGIAHELAAWQREALRARQRIAAEALRGVPHSAHAECLHVWLPLGEGHSEPGFVQHARLQGVAIAPGSAFAIAPGGTPPAGGATPAGAAPPAVRISVGSTSPDELRKGLAVVVNLLKGSPEPVLLAS